jgi:DNA-nicking Smr family endonuclease
MRRRRPRSLTCEERKLWAQVARSVIPLKGRLLDPEPVAETPEPYATVGAPPLSPPAQPRAEPKLPPLVPLERRTVSALRRGRQGVEAVIDLHGMRQSEAHDALRGFLHRSQAAGLKVVLVITGKGAAGADEAPFGDRGVLRRMVPHWLRLPDLRPLVVGFDEAARHHGGSGALYVRLRRSAQAS